MSLSEINNTICNGLDFIKSKQDNDGLWRDFDTLAGSGSEWITGFVSYAVSIHADQTEMVLSAVKSLLSRQRDNGGWSYNESVPSDCDSTAWVLLALSRDSSNTEPGIKKAMRYVISHQNERSGGFSTYNLQDGIQEFIQVSEIDVVNGWTSVHNDVTGVAVQSLLIHGLSVESDIIQRALGYLRKQKNRYHLWDSYWWKGYAYSTYHALRALSMCQAITEEEISYPLQVLLGNQHKDGGWNDSFGEISEVFGTAFVVLSLLLCPRLKTLESARNGALWLINQQNKDGSWPTTPILKIPPPMLKDTNLVKEWYNNQLGTGVIIQDKRRIFSSSAAIWALRLFIDITSKKNNLIET